MDKEIKTKKIKSFVYLTSGILFIQLGNEGYFNHGLIYLAPMIVIGILLVFNAGYLYYQLREAGEC